MGAADRIRWWMTRVGLVGLFLLGAFLLLTFVRVVHGATVQICDRWGSTFVANGLYWVQNNVWGGHDSPVHPGR